MSQQELVAAKVDIRNTVHSIRRRESARRMVMLTQLVEEFNKELEVVQAKCAETGHKWQESTIPFNVYSPVQKFCTWCEAVPAESTELP